MGRTEIHRGISPHLFEQGEAGEPKFAITIMPTDCIGDRN